MVFQSYGLLSDDDGVRKNIPLPAEGAAKIPQAEHNDRVMRASATVELNDFLHRKPADLSGGQRQRVALARAIVREPKVFLIGRAAIEPRREAARLDRAQIKNLHHELKTTTIYVTHDQIEGDDAGRTGWW